jgi:UDP-N-acetylglucosamine 2-epimerase (non-hydrolysing)
VLDKYSPGINESTVLDQFKLSKGDYFLVSAHRQENVDQPKRILELFESLSWIASEFNLPIIVSTHPRTAEKIKHLRIQLPANIQLHQPFGFLDYIKLQQNARAVLSDSGSVSEESAILGFPALTIRDSMERQEALETGSVIMAGISQRGISEALHIILGTQKSQSIPVDYDVKDTSTRVVNFIASTIHSHEFRNALRKL